MNKKKNLINLYLILTLLFTIIGTLAQTLTLFFAYDARMGVYQADTSLGTITAWGLTVLVLILSSALVVLPKEDTASPIPLCNNPLAFLSAMSGGAAICTSLLMAFDARTTAGSLQTLSILLAIFSLPAGVYLILSAITRRTDDKRLTILGFFPVIWLAMCLIRIYFDRTSAINDPLKILLQISLAAIMLYFLTELRARVGKPGYRTHYVIGMISVLLGAASSVSMLALRLNGVSLLRGEIMLSVTELFFSFYIIGRLAQENKTGSMVSLSDPESPKR